MHINVDQKKTGLPDCDSSPKSISVFFSVFVRLGRTSESRKRCAARQAQPPWADALQLAGVDDRRNREAAGFAMARFRAFNAAFDTAIRIQEHIQEHTAAAGASSVTRKYRH